MELITQHTKTIMEGCKERAREEGLSFDDETLEYIVTNRDLLELSPKVMIPTLYDYWVHDLEVLKEKGRYELYPNNPYETVINTRPAISFYNDNNPDWLNVMIFYHVLAHIDFFQNNLFFRHTWDYDFTGQALSDKRLITKLRSEHGRWVDYVIEFARGIDNIVGFHKELSRADLEVPDFREKKLNFYFDVFLQDVKKVKINEYIKEIEKYNDSIKKLKDLGHKSFFAEVSLKYPEFDAMYAKSLEEKTTASVDLLQFIMENSDFIKKEENQWIKSILQIIRKTSLFFQPQIRTKIMNEGWASYWHENLFLKDDRINGHEIDFSRVNSAVTSLPRVGLNPYALGMRIFYYIEELTDKGKYDLKFRQIRDSIQREKYDEQTGKGKEFIFNQRKTSCDSLFISNFIDQDFVTKNKLFVAGRRLNKNKGVWEYYVKSRKAEDYRKMIADSLYHPPFIYINEEKTTGGTLYLIHKFEGKQLVREYLANTMLGIEYLWGGSVKLETNELTAASSPPPMGFPGYPILPQLAADSSQSQKRTWQKVVYTMEKRKLSRKII